MRNDILKAGSFFGENSLMSKTGISKETYEAVDPTELCFLTREVIYELAQVGRRRQRVPPPSFGVGPYRVCDWSVIEGSLRRTPQPSQKKRGLMWLLGCATQEHLRLAENLSTASSKRKRNNLQRTRTKLGLVVHPIPAPPSMDRT